MSTEPGDPEGTAAAGPVIADPLAEVGRILAAAEAAGVPLRAIGGLAVRLRAPSIGRLFPDRAYHDIDLVAPAGRPDVAAFLEAQGYLPQHRFNALNGADRLLFHDRAGRRADVFVDRLRMCHELRLGERLAVDRLTVPLADLLLSKLQIVELTERDRQDVLALFADNDLTATDAGISTTRIEAVCGADWGWWRTVDDNLGALVRTGSGGAGSGGAATRPVDPAIARATGRARALREQLSRSPRSWRWRARALLGTRIPWYDAPEDVR